MKTMRKTLLSVVLVISSSAVALAQPPAFEFHWNLGTNPGTAADTLKTYAAIFHDVENSSNKTRADTLHFHARP